MAAYVLSHQFSHMDEMDEMDETALEAEIFFSVDITQTNQQKLQENINKQFPPLSPYHLLITSQKGEKGPGRPSACSIVQHNKLPVMVNYV